MQADWQSLIDVRALNLPCMFAAKFGRDDHLLVDELQSALTVALVECARAYDCARGTTFHSYAYTVLQYRAIYVRRRFLADKTRASASIDDIDAASIATDSRVDAAVIARELVEKAIQPLSPLERSILYACYVDDMSLVEVANRLKISRQAVSQRLQKVMQRVRDALEQGPAARQGRVRRYYTSARVARQRWCKEMKSARRLAGHVPATDRSYYLHSEQDTLVIGPSDTVKRLFAHLAAVGKYTGPVRRMPEARATSLLSSLGYTLVRGPEARRLLLAGCTLSELPLVPHTRRNREEGAIHATDAAGHPTD